MYLVARMEILTRFLPCWAVSYLLPGFSSYIRSLHPVFGWLYRSNLIPFPLGKLRVLFPWSDSLCKLNLGLWIHTINSSSLLWVSEASFIGIHKICFVRFYLPRESTQETRRMALGRLWTRRKKLHFPNQNSSFRWNEDILGERKENGLYQLLYSCHSNQPRRESACIICLTCFTDPYMTLDIHNFCLVCTRYWEREPDWAFHLSSLSSYFHISYILLDPDHYGPGGSW